MQKAGESPPENSSSTPEMRVTRTVAKNVAKEGGKLWFLDKVQETEAKTPVKKKGKRNSEVPFIAAELPDEEDEEYDPSKDVLPPDLSDEESVASNSTPLSSSFMSTPPSSQDKSLIEFKKPEETSVARALNFDSAEEKRALRSTKSMKEVSIEELDTKFVPPDITEDMYDNEIDDYTLFLAETYGKKVEKEQIEEPFEDPDYEYQEQEEIHDLIDEFKFNRSTKISQKEADLLLQDVLEAYDLNEKQQQKSKLDNTAQNTGKNQSEIQYQQFYQPPNAMFNYQLNQDQKLLIGQQMRQHIQLLTQMSLLTSKDGQWQELHTDCRGMLSELMNRSFNQQFSMYAQDNLFPSIQLLQDWDHCLGMLPCPAQFML